MKGKEGEARGSTGEGKEKQDAGGVRLHYPEVGFAPAPPPAGAERASELIPTHLLGGPGGFTCRRAAGRGRRWGRGHPGGSPPEGRRREPSGARSGTGVAALAAACGGGAASPRRPAPQGARAAGRAAGLRALSPAPLLPASTAPPLTPRRTSRGGKKPALDLQCLWEPHFERCSRAGPREPPMSSRTLMGNKPRFLPQFSHSGLWGRCGKTGAAGAGSVV